MFSPMEVARRDDESFGFSLKKAVKGVAKGVKKSVTAPLSLTKKVTQKSFDLTKKATLAPLRMSDKLTSKIPFVGSKIPTASKIGATLGIGSRSAGAAGTSAAALFPDRAAAPTGLSASLFSAARGVAAAGDQNAAASIPVSRPDRTPAGGMFNPAAQDTRTWPESPSKDGMAHIKPFIPDNSTPMLPPGWGTQAVPDAPVAIPDAPVAQPSGEVSTPIETAAVEQMEQASGAKPSALATLAPAGVGFLVAGPVGAVVGLIAGSFLGKKE